MMESEAGKAVVRSGRKESWGAILRERFVRAVVLWPRLCWRRGRSNDAERMGRDIVMRLSRWLARWRANWVVGESRDEVGMRL